MRIFCPCFNVSADVLLEIGQLERDENFILPNDVILRENEKIEHFFANFPSNFVALAIEGENSVTEEIPVLVEKRKGAGGDWVIFRCNLCHSDVFAKNSGRLLLQRNFLKRQASLVDTRKSNEISQVFNVLLSKSDVSNDISKTGSVSAEISGKLRETVINYVKRERELLDERIRKFVEEQQTAFEITKNNAEKELTELLNMLSSSTIVNTPEDVEPVALRPKSNSNPASFGVWKRKRRSGGGSKRNSEMEANQEEHQDVFSMDENLDPDVAVVPPAAQDDSDVEEGEDYANYYPPAPREEESRDVLEESSEDDFMSARVLNQFGTSLPVTIPAAGPARMFSARPTTTATYGIDENVDDEERALGKEDVGAGIQALAKSIQAVDDPERLFGERPRRRWKTGEIVQQQSSQQFITSAGRRPTAQSFFNN